MDEYDEMKSEWKTKEYGEIDNTGSAGSLSALTSSIIAATVSLESIILVAMIPDGPRFNHPDTYNPFASSP
jgi:hypothetical protein